MADAPPCCRIVVVCGPTASGKSSFAEQLAVECNGEIVNADALQVHQGLDIATNKDREAMLRIPHHCIDIWPPEMNGTVTLWRDMALRAIRDILARKRVPIVTGGTGYYIERLLWSAAPDDIGAAEESASREATSNEARGATDSPAKASACAFAAQTSETFASREKSGREARGSPPESLLADENNAHATNGTVQEDSRSSPAIPGDEELLRWTAGDLSDLLHKHDQQTAVAVHPNHRRRLLRCVQALRDVGDASEGLRAPASAKTEAFDALIIAVDKSESDLETIIHNRTQSMVERGLENEVTATFRLVQDRLHNHPRPLECGILQAIGFREFTPFITGEASLDSCVAEMEKNTVKYARRQRRFISSRLETRCRIVARNPPCGDTERDQQTSSACSAEKDTRFSRPLNSFDRSEKKELGNETNVEPQSLDDVFTRSCLDRPLFARAAYKDDLAWAKRVVLAFLQRHPCPDDTTIAQCYEEREATEDRPNLLHVHFCDRCDMVLRGDNEWKAHCLSRKHYRRGRSVRNAAKRPKHGTAT